MLRPFLPRLLILLIMAALLLLLATARQPSPYSFAMVAVGCLAAIFDGYAGVWSRLRQGGRRGATLQVQVCALWLVGTLAYFTLLNTTAELALPGTFQWRDGPASVLDVVYFTVLTFASSGYGDILPASGLGKVLSMLTSLGGLVYATFLFTAIWHQFAPKEDPR